MANPYRFADCRTVATRPVGAQKCVLMVDDIDLCTYADEDSFFSYRRTTHRKEADYGRHVHAIVLEG